MHGRRLGGHGDEGGGEFSRRSEHREGRVAGGKNSASHSRPDGEATGWKRGEKAWGHESRC